MERNLTAVTIFRRRISKGLISGYPIATDQVDVFLVDLEALSLQPRVEERTDGSNANVDRLCVRHFLIHVEHKGERVQMRHIVQPNAVGPPQTNLARLLRDNFALHVVGFRRRDGIVP